MIRSARPEDAKAIRQIAERAYGSFIAMIGKAPAPMIADFPTHIDRDQVFVFEREAGVAGYAILLNRDQRTLLDNIAVDPDLQRSGVGLALMEHVERHVATLGYETLDLYTNAVMTANIAWYEKLGFVETRRTEEHGFHRVYMSKTISGGPVG